MADFRNLLIDGGFATGMAFYEDRYPGTDSSARIVLKLIVETALAADAIVDTGAPWCILSPEIVSQAGVEVDTAEESVRRLLVRGTMYRGKLLRMTIANQATQGSSLGVDATVFVPLLEADTVWPHPNFVGLDGFLNRIRFAIDPG
jgi:hypothetical protein